MGGLGKPDYTLLVALIGAAATIVAALLPIVLRWWREGAGFQPITTARQRSVAGDWKGTIEDQYVENGQATVKASVAFLVRHRGKTLNVDATLVLEDQAVRLQMKGGFCNDELIQVSYKSVDPRRTQYGVVLFQLSPTGNELAGHYAGYSPTRGCVVAGEFRLTRC